MKGWFWHPAIPAVAVLLYKRGEKYREIARVMRVPKSTVTSWITKAKHSGEIPNVERPRGRSKRAAA